MYSIRTYHCKTQCKKGELHYISFFTIKTNYKNKVSYFIKQAEYCSIALSASSRKYLLQRKARFSGFHSNGNGAKKRKKEYNFCVSHQVYRLCLLNIYFCFPQSHSVSNETFNVKQFTLHSFHKKKKFLLFPHSMRGYNTYKMPVQ